MLSKINKPINRRESDLPKNGNNGQLTLNLATPPRVATPSRVRKKILPPIIINYRDPNDPDKKIYMYHCCNICGHIKYRCPHETLIKDDGLEFLAGLTPEQRRPYFPKNQPIPKETTSFTSKERDLAIETFSPKN